MFKAFIILNDPENVFFFFFVSLKLLLSQSIDYRNALEIVPERSLFSK